MSIRLARLILLAAALLHLGASGIFAGPLRIATFNLENYLIQDRMVEGHWRPGYPKPEAEKTALRAVVREADPDVLAIQEIGPGPFLDELQADLALDGLDYPYAYWMEAADKVRHVAVLSKIPAAGVVRHEDLDFAYLDGRSLVKRGMLELTFAAGGDGEPWKLFVIHLKSSWTEDERDPGSELRRTREAEACRDRIIERTLDLGVDAFLVAGDFNDHLDSAALRRFQTRGDLEIGQRVDASDSRGETWTYHYAKEGSYRTVDGFIVSTALLPSVAGGRGTIVDLPEARKASDHRMVYLDLNP